MFITFNYYAFEQSRVKGLAKASIRSLPGLGFELICAFPIPFSPHTAVIIPSTLLGMLSTRRWRMAVLIFISIHPACSQRDVGQV